MIHPQPNMGIGVVFSAVEPEQLEVLMKGGFFCRLRELCDQAGSVFRQILFWMVSHERPAIAAAKQ